MNTVCLIALCSAALQPFSSLYGTGPSYKSRLGVCVDIARESQSQSVDPSIMIAIGYVESGFTNAVNRDSGASGPLQVMTRFWCKDSNCDLIGAGVFAYQSFRNNKSIMDALCLYGSGYVCRRSKGGTRYAKKVLSSLERITYGSELACELDGC